MKHILLFCMLISPQQTEVKYFCEQQQTNEIVIKNKLTKNNL